jgi:uncharacterized protein YbjT (DUF2867 family)
MRVLVVGANGKIGRQLVAMLAGGEHQAVAVVRDQAQAPALAEHGAEVIVRDLEGDVTGIADGCAAVVFTAGSGGKTGGDKTLLVDLWGACKVIRAAEAAGVDQLIMVSAIGAADPDHGNPKIRHYLVAKRIADDELVRSPVSHTIVRPGRLTDEPGTGRVRAGSDIGYGEIPRADVAATIVACLGNPAVMGKTFCLLAGETPIADAVAGV